MTQKAEEKEKLTSLSEKKKSVKKVAKKATVKKKAAKKAAKKVVKKTEEEILLEAVINGLQDKKAEGIKKLDLRKLDNRVTDYYFVCHATSLTQVTAIADAVQFIVKKEANELPYRTEGYQNSEWIIIDYSNIVVHVFQEEMREFYDIEGLWADADITEIA